MEIAVGTRGSHLALTQTRQVIEQLQNKHPGIRFVPKVIRTKGDRDQRTLLHKMNDKGIFIKELEDELLNGGIDMAVHSMKDMPSVLPEGLILASSPKREIAADILVLRQKVSSLEELRGKKIGTGSKRRMVQLAQNGVLSVAIRGNIETRMKRVETEDLDGVMLAAAGMIRAGYRDKISLCLNPREFVPAACQGILAIETREDDRRMFSLIEEISDRKTNICAQTERAYLQEVGAGCHSPVGAYSTIEGEHVFLTVLFGTEDARVLIKKEGNCRIGDHVQLAVSLACDIKEDVERYEKR